jgi:hypothetical protein
LHHVIIRGIERKNIFRDTTDKQNLVDRLDHLIPQTQKGLVNDARKVIDEVSANALGAALLSNSRARTVINIGGQDVKKISKDRLTSGFTFR